jgi:hypothetical protein
MQDHWPTLLFTRIGALALLYLARDLRSHKSVQKPVPLDKDESKDHAAS